jgi:prepilin-type processing-associated H-X9-DG protein
MTPHTSHHCSHSLIPLRNTVLRRTAMTLVESLIVLGILGTLIALLLPAVQAARQSAARVQCANNLRQLGLALHHFHDVNGKFPPGLTSKSTVNKYPFATWITRSLPYFEQAGAWQDAVAAYQLDPSPFHDPPHSTIAVPIAVLACPLDPRVRSVQVTRRNRLVALTSYVGVLGTDFVARDGILYFDSAVSMGQITDGNAHTVLIGERPPTSDCYYGWWYTGYGQAGSGSPDMLLGVRERNMVYDAALPPCDSGPYHFQPGRLDDDSHRFHFWSLHSGGAHFAFADASVHFLRYASDAILPALATRGGGDSVR